MRIGVHQIFFVFANYVTGDSNFELKSFLILIHEMPKTSLKLVLASFKLNINKKCSNFGKWFWNTSKWATFCYHSDLKFLEVIYDEIVLKVQLVQNKSIFFKGIYHEITIRRAKMSSVKNRVKFLILNCNCRAPIYCGLISSYWVQTLNEYCLLDLQYTFMSVYLKLVQ